jgi:hypothetical protein
MVSIELSDETYKKLSDYKKLVPLLKLEEETTDDLAVSVAIDFSIDNLSDEGFRDELREGRLESDKADFKKYQMQGN